MASYTKEVAKAWKAIKCPVPITVDILGYPDGVAIAIYETEVKKLSDVERVLVMEYLRDVKKAIESFGVNTVIEGLAGEPKKV